MGWLQTRSPFFQYLLLLSCGYFTGVVEHAIAATAPQEAFSSVPVSRQPLPHLKSSFSCLPVQPVVSFNSQQFDKQIQRYLRFVSQVGTPDILIVGSSRALQGIDPIVLQQTLAGRGYPNLKIFNLGVNGATAQVVDLLLREVLSTDQLPRLLLWGDGVRAFNSGRADVTYKRAIASQSYQLLTAGLRPTLPPDRSQVVSCTTVSLPALNPGTMRNPTSFAVSSWGLFHPASKHLSLYEAPLNRSIGVGSLAERENLVLAIQEATGFQPLSDQFNPESYFQRYPRIQGKYDADYRDFNLNGKQTVAFKNVMQLAQAHQIPVIFVNLPLTQIYLDSTRTLREQQFRTYLQQVTRSHGLRVYDLSQRWLNQKLYFTDPSHLNRHGAAAVAAELGRSLVLPPSWSQERR
ncbi:MAG: D-alanyl-lipoteichoic acid biosynthesis protein DltD [Lyngbya sp. HA4199-MV5]|jgi:hypothetical protein|nr:D-alanyl-lipoteichoic acid biosynthesis protein DltD [Lyngbya sp. HA4199-MV5]